MGRILQGTPQPGTASVRVELVLGEIVDAALERVGGEGYLFPAPQDATKPIRRKLAGDWLKEAERLAGLEPMDGSAWHAIRRKFATERKHLPVQDVARVGGWKDLATLTQVYQQPDEETQRRVLSEARRLKRARSSRTDSQV